MTEKHAKKTAEKLLANLWPSGKFPVDPIIIASHLGIQVIETDLPPDVSGAIYKDVDSDPIIVLECTDNPSRKRFTCAHELGHFFNHFNQGLDDSKYEYIDFRTQMSSSNKSDEERFANHFAACLLMPEKEFKRFLKKEDDPIFVGLQFGVSVSAASYRIKNLT